LNYRHAFHAGNFADLVKHAALLALLAKLQADRTPISVVDTHAGRGLYDLAGAEARKSGEAEAGIVRLMAAKDAPAEFRPLREAVGKLNGGGVVRRYPGSPIQLDAQAHLEKFYASFGFARVGEPFDEDGIPHISMKWLPASISAAYPRE